MNSREAAIKFLFALVALTFLAGCGTTTADRGLAGAPTMDFTVSVTCSEPDMKFTGVIISDGRAQKVSGVGDTVFHVKGHKVICSFKKSGAEGRLSVAVSQGSKKLGDASTPTRFSGVRAEFLRTATEHSDLFTTVSICVHLWPNLF